MPLQDKITEILTLVGVNDRDLDAARRNFEQLDPEEIERKLEQLRAGSAKIDAWRAARGSATRATAPASEALSAVEASLKTVLRVDRNLETLAQIIARLEPRRSRVSALLHEFGDRYRRLAQGMSSGFANADVEAGIRFENYLRHKLQAISSSGELAASLATREVEAILKHPLMPSDRPWLTAADTVDAFGRIANAISRKPPNLFIAVNEGLSIALVIKHHLRLEAPIVIVHGAADTDLYWERDPPGLSHPRVIWVIGHVARTGATLVRTIEEAGARYRSKHVYGAVLAASTDAAENLARFAFHQLAEASTVELSFDASKEITINDDDFLLGGEDHRLEEIVPVTRLLLHRAQLDMARAFKDE